MSHQEKQRIFDEYARLKGFGNWSKLKIYHENRSEDYDEHVFAACDLVQEEQQKRIAENANLHWPYDGKTEWIDKDSIINPENKIQ